jgi:ribosomal protein S27AE
MEAVRVEVVTEGAVVDQRPRCWRCGRILAWFASRPWRISCSKCRAVNGSEPSA